MPLREVAADLANRLISIFTWDASGKRPVHGERRQFQEDPHWRDLILFHEYFHAETGEGLGASHQTGWTGLVAPSDRRVAPAHLGGVGRGQPPGPQSWGSRKA